VTEFIWYSHQESGARTYQPESARPMLANSGWFPLPDEDLAAAEQAEADEVAAAEQAMREQAEIALGNNAAEPPPEEVAAAEQAMQEQAEIALNAPPPDPRPLPEVEQTAKENV
jgi:hypothetical protein